MIRFAWRQFRVPFVIAVGGLAIVAIVLGITGPDLSHLYNTTVANCQSQGDCQSAISALDGYDHFLQVIVQALPLVMPALIGMFWGAPLVARELESGTFHLAWTQGRTRWQWLLGKVAVVGLSSVVVMGLLSLMTTWWWVPINRANPNRFSPGLFSIFGLVPVGYAAFAFAFGLMAGVIMRRTLAAMATTLVAFIGARLAVNFWVRPHFASPARLAMALNTSNGVRINLSPSGLNIGVNPPTLPNAWVTSTELVNKTGQQPTEGQLGRICSQVIKAITSNQPSGVRGVAKAGPTPGGAQNAFNTCITKVGASYHELVMYQPASHYWPFQFAETGVFIAAALVAIAISYWWIRRRLT
jgi:ABC-type transport system involved in multi-copper enzyme maturation permease subunit